MWQCHRLPSLETCWKSSSRLFATNLLSTRLNKPIQWPLLKLPSNRDLMAIRFIYSRVQADLRKSKFYTLPRTWAARPTNTTSKCLNTSNTWPLCSTTRILASLWTLKLSALEATFLYRIRNRVELQSRVYSSSWLYRIQTPVLLTMLTMAIYRTWSKSMRSRSSCSGVRWMVSPYRKNSTWRFTRVLWIWGAAMSTKIKFISRRARLPSLTRTKLETWRILRWTWARNRWTWTIANRSSLTATQCTCNSFRTQITSLNALSKESTTSRPTTTDSRKTVATTIIRTMWVQAGSCSMGAIRQTTLNSKIIMTNSTTWEPTAKWRWVYLKSRWSTLP